MRSRVQHFCSVIRTRICRQSAHDAATGELRADASAHCGARHGPVRRVAHHLCRSEGRRSGAARPEPELRAAARPEDLRAAMSTQTPVQAAQPPAPPPREPPPAAPVQLNVPDKVRTLHFNMYVMTRDGGKWWSKDHHLMVVKIVKNVAFS